MNKVEQKSGERAKTRAMLLDVFNELLLSGETGRPKVAEVIAGAGVARSTFYDHFDGIEALLNESLSGLFAGFAQAIVTRRDPEFLVSLIEHVGENRAMAREFLSGERGDRAQALFAQVIECELDGRTDARLTGILIAGTTLTALKNWVSGRISDDPRSLSERLMATAGAILSQQES